MTREEQRVAYVELRKQLLPHPPIADATKWVQAMSDKQFDKFVADSMTREYFPAKLFTEKAKQFAKEHHQGGKKRILNNYINYEQFCEIHDGRDSVLQGTACSQFVVGCGNCHEHSADSLDSSIQSRCDV